MAKRIALLAAGLFFLTACGNTQSPELQTEALQQRFAEYTSLTTKAHIVSDLDERTLAYDVLYEWNKDGAGKITILSPDEVAGIEASIQGDNYTLVYEGTELETGMPDRKGVTPADVLPCLMKEIGTAIPVRYWEEEGKTALRMEHETDGVEIAKEIYFDKQTGSPENAELFVNGVRVLGLTFTEFKAE